MLYRSSTWNKIAWGTYPSEDDMRGWGTTLEECIQGLGLIKYNTNIDWNSFSVPNTNYGVLGYSDFQLPSGPYQPLYLRITFGVGYRSSSSSYYTYLEIRPQISNDSTFATFASYPYRVSTGWSKAAQTGLYWEGSYDDHTLVITEGKITHPNTTLMPQGFIVERTRDMNYDVNNTGAYVQMFGNGLQASAASNAHPTYYCQMFYPENPSDPSQFPVEYRGQLWQYLHSQKPTGYIVPNDGWNAPQDDGNGNITFRAEPVYGNWRGTLSPVKAVVSVPKLQVPSMNTNLQVKNEVTNETNTYRTGLWCAYNNNAARFMDTWGLEERMIYKWD